MTAKVFVHMLLWNSVATHGLVCVQKSLQAIIGQTGFVLEKNLKVVVSDNASAVNEAALLEQAFSGQAIGFRRYAQNYGFSAGYNIAAAEFINSDCTHFLMLNPDCFLKAESLGRLLEAFQSEAIGMATPRLLQADAELNLIIPEVIDSTGIQMTKSLRHLDRGNGELDTGQYNNKEDVFGGTGACLLIKKECLKDLSLPKLKFTTQADLVHTSLKSAPTTRVDFLDEAFFAYREDADLAWRAQRFGWRCVYVPQAVGYHRRVVTPEKREQISPEINRHGVRNRYLLQLYNYSLAELPSTVLLGFILRNLFVILAVILKERSSLAAFKDIYVLWQRSLERRKYIFSKTKVTSSYLASWFK